MENYNIVVTGGGAAGYFCAANLVKNNDVNILILEKSNNILSKVKVSGGGRCNLTNLISDPGELIRFYPRGGNELLGPFYRFNSADTVKWFTSRGIELKNEDDGRIFPVSDDSQTIISCLLNETDSANLKLLTRHGVDDIKYQNNKWIIACGEKLFETDYLIITPGSSERIWGVLKKLGHSIIKPVPSLFTFNINDKLLSGLAGVSVENVISSIKGFKENSEGPLLITHHGLSGPSVLKLSSFAARFLYDKKYNFTLRVNWLPHIKATELMELLLHRKIKNSMKSIHKDHLQEIPVRLWEKLMLKAAIPEDMKWKDLPKIYIESIAGVLKDTAFTVTGKSTFKEEFVTAGGVDLKEVNFKTMESKLYKNLFFAGEVLNIDAVTGGFNFQAAWTTAWIAAKTISGRLTIAP
jgi:predicted Rossmann fold flavoprotein